MAFEGLSDKLSAAFKRLRSKGKLSEAEDVYKRQVNADREAHGKKPFDDGQTPTPPKKKRDNTSKKKQARQKKEAKKRKVTQSVTDPDSGLFVKGSHKRQFAYEAHTVCDGNGFVLETVVTPGNVHDLSLIHIC